MIDKRLYCETFSRLCASEEAKKEVFQMMKEKKEAKRLPRVLRAGAIAAVMTVVLAVSAGAADLASGGALFRSLREVWSDGYETRYEAVDQDGNQLMFSVSAGARIEKRDDGKVMVLCAAGEEVNITENMELTETVTDSDGTAYTNRFTSDDVETACKFGTTVVTETDDGPDESGVVKGSVVTVTGNGGEDITVTREDTGDVLTVDSAKRDYRSGLFTIEPAETPEEP